MTSKNTIAKNAHFYGRCEVCRVVQMNSVQYALITRSDVIAYTFFMEKSSKTIHLLLIEIEQQQNITVFLYNVLKQ